MMDISRGWACPQCNQPITQSGQHLLCPEHGKIGKVQQGLASFLQEERYWGELPQEQMQFYLARAEEAGWELMLNELAEAHPDLHASATDAVRANWLHLYPGPASGAALDIGAGWGVITQALAGVFDQVYAVDSVLERARLLACRFRGQDKVRVAAAAFPDVPLARGSLQLVVMNGVLEWLAVGRPERDPARAQLACLRRAVELLRPGGWLYLGIENRWGLHLWQGSRDHSGRPYTSLMPRWLAHRICRRAAGYRTRQEGYRTYTYGYWGYRRLLRRAGLSSVTIYAALPGYNRPESLVPLHRSEPLDCYLAAFAEPSRKQAVAARLPGRRLRTMLARLLAPHFAILAQKGAN